MAGLRSFSYNYYEWWLKSSVREIQGRLVIEEEALSRIKQELSLRNEAIVRLFVNFLCFLRE